MVDWKYVRLTCFDARAQMVNIQAITHDAEVNERPHHRAGVRELCDEVIDKMNEIKKIVEE